ncbi:MAG: hypothetical protein H8D45_13955 [Bacteroidetes bacterium]|nr:hypothetical protein [Bacteroidota bacterium]MBL7105884.1 hypothetical protein [Bacteroidales bacterium]
MYKIGILAYGSLINNPGKEIEPLIIDRISCRTPFKVEYARTSKSRNGAPTLILTESFGNEVSAIILVLKNTTDLNYAKSILWRRERHKIGDKKEYVEPKNPTINQVVVKTINNFKNVETVIYTSIGKNIDGTINPEILAELAIDSILKDAGKKGEDGIRYLLSAKNNGIITEFSKKYEQLILEKTETKTLEDAIKKLDAKRNED